MIPDGCEALSARAREAGLPLGVPTMVDSKTAGHAERKAGAASVAATATMSTWVVEQRSLSCLG
jgi:hypothetical protein